MNQIMEIQMDNTDLRNENEQIKIENSELKNMVEDRNELIIELKTQILNMSSQMGKNYPSGTKLKKRKLSPK